MVFGLRSWKFPMFKFAAPEKCEVVILHHNTYWIERYVLDGIKTTKFSVYPKSFFIELSLILLFVRRISILFDKETRKHVSFEKLINSLYLIYILACIEKTSAKIVITMIDNSIFAQKLSVIDKNREYFFIQNGTRTKWCVKDSRTSLPLNDSVIHMQHFFCFGQRDVDLFNTYRHKINNYYPIGSLVLGCYKSSVVSTPELQFDLCFISQWSKEEFLAADGVPQNSFEYRSGKGQAILHTFMERLVQDRDLRVAVCLRSDNPEEMAAYQKWEKDSIFMTKINHTEFSTYHTSSQSHLVIAFNSTVLSEMFALEKKVLWCNTVNDHFFEMPEAGISYFFGDDYSLFESRVFELLEMPQLEYKKPNRDRPRHICNFNPNLMPQDIIRSKVFNAIHQIEMK